MFACACTIFSFSVCFPVHATTYTINGTQNSFGAGGTDVLNSGDTLNVNGVLDANGAISAVLFAPGASTTTVSNSGTIDVSTTNVPVMRTNAGGGLGTINITNSGNLTALAGTNNAFAMDLSAGTSGNITFVNSGNISGALRFPATSTSVFTMNSGALGYVTNGGNTVNLLDASTAGNTNANATLNLNGGTITGKIAGFNNFNINTNFSTGGANPGTITNCPNITVMSGTFTVNDAITNTTATPTAFVIDAGATVRPTVLNVLPATGVITVNGGGNLNLNGFSQTIGDLAGNGSVILSNASGEILTFGTSATTANFTGIISGGSAGVGGITKTNSGTQTLSGANTFAGTTTLLAGTLILGHNTALGTSALNLNSGNLQSTTVLTIANQYSLGAASSIGGAQSLTINNSNPANLNGNLLTVNNTANTITLQGVISGGLGSAITFNSVGGLGSLALANANTFVGNGTFGVNLIAGTLILGTNTSLGNGGVLRMSGGALQASAALTGIANTFTMTGNSSMGGTNNFVFTNGGDLAGRNLLVNNTAGSIIQLGVLSDTGSGGSITMNGANGILKLLAANNYTGGTTLTNGTIVIGNTGSLGTGALNLNGGTLQSSTALTITNQSTLNAASFIGGAQNLTLNNTVNLNGNLLTVNNTANTITLQGVVSGNGGSAITVNGLSSLVLANANTFVGGATLTSGTLILGTNTSLGNGGTLRMGGGTLQASTTLANIQNTFTMTAPSSMGGVSSFTFTNGGDLHGQALNIINTSNSVITLGALSDTGAGGSISVGGVNGTLALPFANTYSGGTTLTNGILLIGNNGSLGSSGLSMGGGTLKASATLSGVTTNFTLTAPSFMGGTNSFAFGNTNTGDLHGQNLTVNNSNTSSITLYTLSDTGTGGSITMNSSDGTGTLILPTANTYSNGTTLIAGAVSANLTGALGLGAISLNGGKLQNTSNALVTLANAYSLNSNSSIGGTFSLTLSNANGALGGNTLTVNNTNNSTVTISGVLSGSAAGSLTLNAATGSTLSLTGVNTYGGLTTVNGGTLLMGAVGALPVNGNLTVNVPGIFSLNGFNQTAGDLSGNGNILLSNAGGETLTFGTAGFAANFSGVISGGTATGGITKTNTGSQILSGLNTFTGLTTVNNGALQMGANNAFSANSKLTVITPGVFDLHGFNQTTSDLNGNGSITLLAGETFSFTGSGTTFSGIISGGTGGGGITKINVGIEILSGLNTYAGLTTVSGGTLQMGIAGALPTNSNLTVNSPGIFDLHGFSQTAGNLNGNGSITLSAAGGETLTFGTNAINANFSGIISGGSAVGGILKQASGTQTLSGVNTYTGLTTVSAGTLQMGAIDALPNASGINRGNLTVAGGATFALNGFNQRAGDVNGAGSITLLAGETLTLGTTATTANFTGVISGGTGGGGVTKANTGTQILTGVNTYLGLTTVSSGTLRMGAADALPNASVNNRGNLTVAGGATFDLNGFSQRAGDMNGAGSITLSAISGETLTFGTTATTANFSGVISGGSAAAGGITKTNTGTQTLSGVNTYAGLTTVSNGTLKMGVIGALPANGNLTIASAGIFALSGFNQTAGDINGSGSITLSAAGGETLTFGTTGNTANFSGVISGGSATGGITKTNTGTQILSGLNTFIGLTTINNGTLQMGANNSFSATSKLTVTSPGVFDLHGFNQTTGDLSGNGSVTLLAGETFSFTGSSTTFSGIISGGDGTGGITKINAGIETLSGLNTYAGLTTVTGGTLRMGIAGALPANGNLIITNPGIFALNGFNQTAGDINGNAGAGITLTAGETLTFGTINTTANFAGSISGGTGGGGITKVNSGTQVFSGVNTYLGLTTVNAGTLQMGINDALPNASVANRGNLTVAAGATFALNGFNQRAGDVNGAGSIALLAGETLTLGTTASIANFTGVISGGTGAGGIAKANTGTQTLTGVNTYLGLTSVNGGTLKMGAVGALPAGGNLSLTSPGIFALNNFSQTAGDIVGNTGSQITLLASETLTFGTVNTTANFAGSINGGTGGGGITKANSGTQVLSGVNTYLGLTTVNAGTLQMGVNDALPNASVANRGNLTLAAGATFALNGFSQRAGDVNGAGSITLLAGETLTLGTTATTANFTGVISGGTGAGGMTKTNTGTQILSGVNTYTGLTSIANGTLLMGATGALSTNSNLTIAGPGILALNGFSQTIKDLTGSGTINFSSGESFTFGTANTTIFSGIISGNGTVIKQGSGTVTLSGANNYTGSTVVNAGTLILSGNNTGAAFVNSGTLQLNNINVLAAGSPVNIASGAIFNLANFSQTIGDLSGAGDVILGSAPLTVGTNSALTTFSGVISGTGSVNKQGSGTWILTGANQYSGGTTVSAGTLQVNTSTIPGNIVNNANVVFNQTTTGTYSNVISGMGNLIKRGNGNLILTNNNPYHGSTTVEAGLLSVNGSIGSFGSNVTVNSGATLAGVGIINGNVINNGTVSPGNPVGLLTINGDYNPGPTGITSIEINPATDVSLLNINGTANLNGTLSIVGDPGVYTPDKRYVMLEADNMTGQFKSFTPFIGPYRVGVFYDHHSAIIEISFTIAQLTPQLVGANFNEQAIAAYIDSLPIPPVGSDLGDNVIGPLTTSHLINGADLNAALESISVGRMNANSVVMADMNAMVNGINTSRLRRLRKNNDLDTSTEISFNSAPQTSYSDPLNALRVAKGKTNVVQQKNFSTTHHGFMNDAADNLLPLLQIGTQRCGIWAYGYGHFADQKAYRADPGYHAKTGGIVGGVDYSPYRDTIVGVGFGHAATMLHNYFRTGKSKVNHNFVTAYGSLSPDNWYVDVSMIAGFTHTSNRQHIQFLSNTPFELNRNAFSDHHGYELTPHVGAGYDIAYKDAVLTPFVNFDYSYIHDNKFVTDGAQSLNQNVQSSFAMLLRSELGIKVSDNIPVETSMARGEFTPDFTLSIVDKRSLRKGHIKAGFVDQPGYYLVNYYTRSREEVAVGVGATLQMNNGGFISARFNSEFGVKYHSNEVSLKVGYAF